MRRRHPAPIPRVWLMTDERMGEDLWRALDRLPRGGGVVLRHHATPVAERRALIARAATIARRRRLVLLVAGGSRLGDGAHNARAVRGLVSRSAHSRREAIAARRAGADLIFVSPVFATRSHPGARVLGRARLGLMIRGIGVPLVALGGMTARRGRSLARLGIHGWAAIDAWL